MFLRPKKLEPVTFNISENARAVLEYYVQYCDHSPDIIVDKLIVSLYHDRMFLDWIYEQRNNKRMITRLGLPDEPPSPSWLGVNITDDEGDVCLDLKDLLKKETK